MATFADRRRERPLRRRPVLVAVVLAGGLLLATSVVVVGRGPADSRLAHAARVRAYEVVFRLHELGRAREETLVVRPPYESLRTSDREGRRTGTLVNDQGLWQLGLEPSHGWGLVDPGRRRAEGDVRPLGALELLAASGLATRGSEASVVGRPCTTYRVAEPIGSRATRAPTGDDHVDLCVDRTGVVLRERWVAGGELVREQEAIAFDATPRLAPGTFRAVPVDAQASGVQRRREVPLTDEIVDQLEVSFDLPPSVHDDGGTAIVDVDVSGRQRGTVRRFLRRHDQVVDIEETVVGAIDPRRGMAHDVPVGDGYVETDLRTITLTIVLPGGTAVILRGLDIGLLDTVAGALRIRGEVTR